VADSVSAGVSLFDRAGRRETQGASDERVERVDDLQYALDEGPCLAAWSGRMVIRIDDLLTDDRWPRWARAAEALGVRASLSAPVVAGDRTLGALKVYATRPAVFGSGSEHRLSLFAAQAAILLAHGRSRDVARRHSEELVEALRTRDRVNMAKGVLMAQEGIGEDAALGLLTARARVASRTLRDTADRVLRSAARRRR
jgi:GAF domain-containing protein